MCICVCDVLCFRCVEIRDWTIIRSLVFGVYYTDQCSVNLKGMTLVENSIATLIHIALPAVIFHQYADKYLKVI